MKVFSLLFLLFVFTNSSFSQDYDKMSKKELRYELDLFLDSLAVLNSNNNDFELRFDTLDSKYRYCLEESNTLSLRVNELLKNQSKKESEILELDSTLGRCRLELDSALLAAEDSIIYLKEVLDSVNLMKEFTVTDTMLFINSEIGDRGAYITFQSPKYKLMNQADSLITFDEYDILDSAYNTEVIRQLIDAVYSERVETFIGRKFIVEIVLTKKESWYGSLDWGYRIDVISPSLKSAEPIE